MNQPLFSVLVANYNNGCYLLEAIDSVRSQTYLNWEIILVDDASTDSSHELYASLLDDQRIHIFYNDKNRGCAYTKHQCMLHANGYYCGYLDPDDVLLPNALESAVRALERDEHYVLSFSRHYVCDAQLNVVEESRLLVLEEGESYFEHHDYRAEVFAAFKKEAYFSMGGLNLSNRAGVDADLYFRLEEVGKIVIIDEFTYKYRRTSFSITSNWEKMAYWNFIIRHDTCLRRGLPVEKYSYSDYLKFINLYADTKSAQATQVLSSKAYKIGKMILAPIHWFRRK